MKNVHNESGDCSCTSCINKSGSSHTSLKRMIRTGSRASRLHYGNKVRPKDKKLLDKLVATRKEYDKLRSELLTGDSDELDGGDIEDNERTLLELIKLVDKGEASEHNALGECCNCCVCESLKAMKPHKKRRLRHAGRHRGGRADDSSSSSEVSQHKDTRRKVPKQTHSDPCTCTLKLSSAIKRRSRDFFKEKRNREESAEDDNKAKKKRNKTLEKIKHSESIMRQALKDEIKMSIKTIQQSKSRIQQNPDISSEVVKVAREKKILQSQAERKRHDRKAKDILEDTTPFDQQKKSAKTIAGLVQDSKIKLKDSVEMLARKSVEKIKDLENKRQLAQHICDCPEVAAELTKMAKQSLTRQELPSELAENASEKGRGSKLKMSNKTKVEATKSGSRIADIAQKSVHKIKQLDSKRKVIQKDVISMTRKSLKRNKLESTEKLSKFKKNITAKVQQSSEKLTEQIQASKIRIRKNITSKVKMSTDTFKDTKHQLGQASKKLSQHMLSNKKRLRKKKGSKTKYQEVLDTKSPVKDYECDPPCFPEECTPQECYEKILLRNANLAELRETDNLQVIKKSLNNLSSRLEAVQSQHNAQKNRTQYIAKTAKRQTVNQSKAHLLTSKSNHKGTSQNLDKKGSAGKAIATSKPTVTLKVGIKNKKEASRICQCDKTNTKSIHSITNVQNETGLLKPITHVVSMPTEENTEKRKLTSSAKRGRKLSKSTKTQQDFQEKRKTRSVNSMVSINDNASQHLVKHEKVKTLPKLSEREQSFKNKNIKTVNNKFDRETGRRNVVRISSTFNIDIEFSKENDELNEARKKISSGLRSHNRSQTNLKESHKPVYPQKELARDIKVDNKTLSHQSRPSEKPNVRFIKNKLYKCLCAIKIGDHRQKHQKTSKKKNISKGTFMNDQSHIQFLKSTATGTKGQRNAGQYKRVKHRTQGSNTFNRKTKSTSSFTSGSITLPKNRNVQSIPTIRKSKKQAVRKKNVPKVMSYPGNSERQAVRVGSNFSFSIEFYKENASPTTESPVFISNKILRKSSDITRKSLVNQKGSQGDGKLYKTGTKGTRVRKSSEVSVGSQSSQVLRTDRGNAVKPILKRCFCTLNLPTRGINRLKKASGLTVVRPQTYIVSRMTEVNKNLPTVATIQAKSQPLKYNVSNGSLLNQIISTSSYSMNKYNNNPFLFEELGNLRYLNNVKNTSTCVLRNARSSNLIARFSRFCKKKSVHFIKNKSLKRCLSAFDLQVPPREENHQQHTGVTLKSAQCNLADGIPCNRTPSAGQKQINKRFKRPPKRIFNAEFADHTAQFTASSSIALRPRFKDIKQSEVRHYQTNPIFSVSPFTEMQTVYRQALLPYECEPNICIPGECDPYNCLKLIKNRTKEGATQSKQTLWKSTSTESNIRQMNEGLQINRGRVPNIRRRANYNRTRDKSSNETGLSVAEPSRQAVRIGSNFSVNVEFFKDDKPDFIMERKEKPSSKLIENRSMSVMAKRGKREQGTHGTKIPQHTQKHSQIELLIDEKSTMTSSLRKRCFCTAKLLGHKVTEQPIKKGAGKKKAATNTKKFKQEKTKSQKTTKQTSETGTLIAPQTKTFLKKCGCYIKNVSSRCGCYIKNVSSRKKAKTKTKLNVVDLDPNECEPGVCIPGACDPYVCLDRIKKRKYDSTVNTDKPRKKTKGCVCEPIKTPKGQNIQTTALRDNASTMEEKHFISQKTKKKHRRRIPHTEHVTEHETNEHEIEHARQVVKIASNISFSVEFYKHGSQSTSDKLKTVETPVRTVKTSKPYSGRTREISTSKVGNIQQGTSHVNIKKTKEIQTLMKKASRCFCTLSLNKNKQLQSQSQGSVGTFLKRCLCTLKLQKEDKQNTSAVKTSASTKIHGNLLVRPKIHNTVQTKHTSPKRIKQRELHSKGSGIDPTSRVDRGSISSRHYLSRGIHAKKENRKQKYRNIGSENKQAIIHRDIISPPVSDRQAVRLGSNFSLNIEFYKENVQNGVTRATPALDFKSQNKGNDIKKHSRNIQSKPAYSKSVGSHGYKNRRGVHSQSDGIQTEERAVGTFLRRCFCTLNLQKNKSKNKEQHSKDIKSTQINLKNKKDVHHFREIGTATKCKRLGLKPYECEPNICIPGQCNPYECYERIKSCYKCCGSEPCTTCDKCIETLKSEKHSTATHPDKAKHRTKIHQTRRTIGVKERPNVTHTESIDHNRHRQAVRIGSNFSFNVEFFKDNQIDSGGKTLKSMDTEICKQTNKSRYKKLESKETLTKHIKANKGAGGLRCSCDAESQMVHQRKNTGAGTDRMLKRCFCTMKLQQKQSHGHPVINKVKYPNNQKVYNVVIRGINTASEILSAKRKCKAELKTYECEPSFCGEPYECLQRIKKHHLRTSGTLMESRFATASSMASSCSTKVQEIKGERLNFKQQQDNKPYQQNKIVEKPRFTNAFGKRNIQSIKIGSDLNFNIESYKEYIPAQAKYNNSVLNSHSQGPKIKTVQYNDDGISTTSRRTRNRFVSNRPALLYNQSPMTGVKTESKPSGTEKALKRCFCTLKLQKNSLQPTKMQRKVTIGRVYVEDDRKSYYKQAYKPQMPIINRRLFSPEIETIFLSDPNVCENCSQTILLGSRTHKCQKYQYKKETNNRRKLQWNHDSVINIKQSKPLHSRQIREIRNSEQNAGKPNENVNKTHQKRITNTHVGIHQFLNHYFTLLLRHKKSTSMTKQDLIRAKKDYCDKKLHASSALKLPSQKKSNEEQKKVRKSSKSDRRVCSTEAHVPAKKSKSLKISKLHLKELDQESRPTNHQQIDRYSPFQSGDAVKPCTYNVNYTNNTSKTCKCSNSTIHQHEKGMNLSCRQHQNDKECKKSSLLNDKNNNIKIVHYADDGLSRSVNGTPNRFYYSREYIRTETNEKNERDLKGRFCTLKLQNQSMEPPIPQRTITAGRVSIEEERTNYNKQSYKPEMETIFPYKPKKFRCCNSKTVLRNYKHKYHINHNPGQTISCRGLYRNNDSMTNVRQRKRFRKGERSKIRGKDRTKATFHNLRSHQDKIGIVSFLKHYVLSLLHRKKTSGVRQNLKSSKINNYYDKKLHAASAPKITAQRRTNLQHSKVSKSSKNNRQSTCHVPAKKSKSLKIAKEHSQVPRFDQHRLDRYSRYQWGDAQEIRIYNERTVSKDKTCSNFEENHQFKCCKGNNPFKKKYLVGYSLKSKTGKRSDTPHPKAYSLQCDQCQACTMSECYCLKQKKKSKTMCKCKQLKDKNNKSKKKKEGINNTYSNESPPNKNKTNKAHSGIDPSAVTCKSDKPRAVHKFKDEVHIKQAMKTSCVKICKICKIKNKNKKVKHDKKGQPDQNPLFVVKIDSTNSNILNREETVANIVHWNMEKSGRNKPARKKQKKIKLKRKPCVCGSTVCDEETERITTKLELDSIDNLETRPCICGSEVCAKRTKAEAHLTKKNMWLKTHKPSKPKPKKKLKTKSKTKPKPKKPTKKKKQPLFGKLLRKGSKARIRSQDKRRTKLYLKAARRRHRHHLKRTKKLAKLVKKQREDPDRFLIADSVLDFANMAKLWISSAAGQTYRTVRSPSQTYRNLERLINSDFMSKKSPRRKGYNTTLYVTRATFRRIWKRMQFTTYFKKLYTELSENKFGHMLLHMSNRKKRKEFKPPRPITEVERAAQCGLYLSTLRKKPCLWVYDRWPSFYPHCVSMVMLFKQFTDVVFFLLAIVVWSPCIFCVEICRGCMCCTFCTQ